MRVALTRALVVVAQVCVAGLAACGSAVSSAAVPRPCAFLSQTIAGEITGDRAMTNRATNVTEAASGYVACVFTDTADEVNSVAVRIKKVGGGVKASTLQGAATFFAQGEPVAPYQPFSVTGIGDRALGESTTGVAFVVFSHGDLLVYVGGSSASVVAPSLRTGIETLATHVASAL